MNNNDAFSNFAEHILNCDICKKGGRFVDPDPNDFCEKGYKLVLKASKFCNEVSRDLMGEYNETKNGS